MFEPDRKRDRSVKLLENARAHMALNAKIHKFVLYLGTLFGAVRTPPPARYPDPGAVLRSQTYLESKIITLCYEVTKDKTKLGILAFA